ncbi:MAG: YceI family protein [Verrucomicrobiota bacterium]
MKNLLQISASLLGAFLLTATTLNADDHKSGVAVYKIDAVHSGVTFKIRHFFTKVPGSFGGFSGEIHFDKDHLDKSKAVATIDLTTVDTNNGSRDGHLQNEDFFNTSEFPEAKFVSTKFEESGEMKYKIHGDLTILGMTKPVVLDAEFLGEGPGRNGAVIMGWDAMATFDRRDWGLEYGQGVVGNDVEVSLNLQAKKQ